MLELETSPKVAAVVGLPLQIAISLASEGPRPIQIVPDPAEVFDNSRAISRRLPASADFIAHVGEGCTEANTASQGASGSCQVYWRAGFHDVQHEGRSGRRSFWP